MAKNTRTVFLYKDDNEYKDDYVTGINGKLYQIQRGKDVDVPEEVYWQIKLNMAQDHNTAELIERTRTDKK